MSIIFIKHWQIIKIMLLYNWVKRKNNGGRNEATLILSECICFELQIKNI
jgi:hypothetical protein